MYITVIADNNYEQELIVALAGMLQSAMHSTPLAKKKKKIRWIVILFSLVSYYKCS